MEESKTLPAAFQAIWDGIKTYEVRSQDFWKEPYRLWSVLYLREWDGKKYTGREIAANITYITHHDWLEAAFGVDPKLCVLGIKVYQKIDLNDPESKAPKV
jgi:hypothetical protein